MESYPSMMSSEQGLDWYELNSRSNSVAARWIKQELEEMQSNPSDDFKCLALTGNIYDWQFAIRGPNGTEFEGGIYHGRIQFSEEYPHKAPKFTLLTENGRFKTQTEIHFEISFSLQSIGVRSTLLRLIDTLPTRPDDALGSVEYDKEERRALAIKSREAAPRYGTAERQKLIDEIHEYMLSKVAPVPSNGGGDIRVSSHDGNKVKQGKRIYIFGNTIKSNKSKRTGVFDFDQKKKDDSISVQKKRGKTKTCPVDKPARLPEKTTKSGELR